MCSDVPGVNWREPHETLLASWHVQYHYIRGMRDALLKQKAGPVLHLGHRLRPHALALRIAEVSVVAVMDQRIALTYKYGDGGQPSKEEVRQCAVLEPTEKQAEGRRRRASGGTGHAGEGKGGQCGGGRLAPIIQVRTQIGVERGSAIEPLSEESHLRLGLGASLLLQTAPGTHDELPVGVLRLLAGPEGVHDAHGPAPLSAALVVLDVQMPPRPAGGRLLLHHGHRTHQKG
eukprot:scaffold874_cov380-Prasinococcus_capsulatus_cf.AAC.15